MTVLEAGEQGEQLERHDTKSRGDSFGPIGLFDSGVGGLSVLRVLERKLPGERFIYFGDTARAPYGGRGPREISRFGAEIGAWLAGQGCKMLVAACNTVSVLGMEALRAAVTVPVLGMAAATVAEALDAKDGEPWPVGLIATAGALGSGRYQKAIAELAPDKPLYAQACPDFVVLVEKGELSGPAVERAVAEYLAPLKKQGIRTLILGCTHYPFLAPAIAAYLGGGVRLGDPSGRLAAMAEQELRRSGRLRAVPITERDGSTFYCSGEPEEFKRLGARLLGRPLNHVEKQVFE